MIGTERSRSATTRRADQWLWFARFFKSRTSASRFCLAGRLRVNAVPVAKSSHELKEGDILTFYSGGRVRVVRVLALGVRRGPAAEARGLYQDLNRCPVDAADSRAERPQRTSPDAGRLEPSGR